MKTIQIALVVVLLALVVAGTAKATDDYLYPMVAFHFEPGSWAYQYTVTVTPNDSFPLGYLELDTLIKNSGITAWTMEGPQVGIHDLQWTTMSREYDDNLDAAIWYVLPPNQHEIIPAELGGNTWVGVFTLIAPYTEPGDGWGLTMDGVEPSANSFIISVPGPTPVVSIVPEPASLTVLGSGLVGFGGMLFRRRKA